MQHDWANLCRQYRANMGLKQEAMAQDFRVTQATVSRWEAGRRIPGPHIRRQILAALEQQNQMLSGPLLQLALLNVKSPIMVWNQSGYLQLISERLSLEVERVSLLKNPIGRHANDIYANQDLMDFVLDGLQNSGFFNGDISAARLMHRPICDVQRAAVGGTITVSILPTEISPGEVGMFCIYDHDVLSTPPCTPQLTIVPRGETVLALAA